MGEDAGFSSRPNGESQFHLAAVGGPLEADPEKRMGSVRTSAGGRQQRRNFVSVVVAQILQHHCVHDDATSSFSLGLRQAIGQPGRRMPLINARGMGCGDTQGVFGSVALLAPQVRLHAGTAAGVLPQVQQAAATISRLAGA